MTLHQSGDEHLIIEEMGLSPTQIETQILENMAPPPFDVPYQSLAEDVIEIHKRQLPQCQTRGIPKPTYEPKLSSKVKYPMSHYVSNHRSSELNISFVNQLFPVSIPNSVQEALANPRWKAVMKEEMKSS